jgi:branched-subunit amino acid permease
VLSTSMALSLVFADYIRETLFKNKIGHNLALFLAVLLSFLLSIIGFSRLAVLITYAMSTLYPLLLVITAYAFVTALRRNKELGIRDKG